MAFYEHRLYLPIIGILLIFALLPWKARKLWYVAVGFLTFLTILHSRAFSGQISFWEQAARTSPNLPRTHNSLGIAYANANRPDDAFREYQIAYGLNPDDYLINAGLANAYRMRHEYQIAEEYFKKAIAINPDREQARYGLGFLYATQGRFEEAEREWLLVIKTHPWHAPSLEALAVYYAQGGRFGESIHYINRLIDIGAPILPELMKILETHSDQP